MDSKFEQFFNCYFPAVYAVLTVCLIAKECKEA